MCGITGIFGNPRHLELEHSVKRMTDSLYHRGPDDSGVWVNNSECIALGHRRLSIIDLSPAGHQPMMSDCGRYMISFNGEIYNHLELRKKLENHSSSVTSQTQDKETISWKGHSDTETLLAAIEQWGIEETLRRSVGMFAISLWDKRERKLILARDRMGEKPLYYGWCHGSFLFASELKAFKQYPGFNNEIDRNVLALYFRYNYVPSPYSIYKGIYKLEPGCLLTIDLNGVKTPIQEAPREPTNQPGFSISRWWSLQQAAETGQSKLITNEQDVLEQLESRLCESIKLQSIADVPLGAFLSGGIDSSLIVALMQSQSNMPIKTFTIGFNEQGYDEAVYGRAVAKHLNTDHTELYVSAEEARAVIPKLHELYDEPFADSSQIPTFLVSTLARQHVTVALSGDAGDELFGGYNRYFWSRKIWKCVAWLPYGARNTLAHAITALPTHKWDLMYELINNHLRDEQRINLFGDKLHKMAGMMKSVKSLDGLYFSLVSGWKQPTAVVLHTKEPDTLNTESSKWPSFSDHEHLMMYLDSMTYLPDDILCKVDRASMRVSMETRVPFLDHRVIELAWRLPLDMKIRDGQGKWALRQLLYKYVPSELIERPKQGFSIPLGEWLRGPLRNWAENLLDPVRLKQEGFLRYEPIHKKWTEHLSGKRNWEHQLWSVLMFQAWLDSQQEIN